MGRPASSRLAWLIAAILFLGLAVLPSCANTLKYNYDEGEAEVSDPPEIPSEASHYAKPSGLDEDYAVEADDADGAGEGADSPLSEDEDPSEAPAAVGDAAGDAAYDVDEEDADPAARRDVLEEEEEEEVVAAAVEEEEEEEKEEESVQPPAEPTEEEMRQGEEAAAVVVEDDKSAPKPVRDQPPVSHSERVASRKAEARDLLEGHRQRMKEHSEKQMEHRARIQKLHEDHKRAMEERRARMHTEL